MESTKSTMSTTSTYPEIAANGVLALIAVACSLLNRQIASLEKAFMEEGGFTERLYKVRSERRNRAQDYCSGHERPGGGGGGSAQRQKGW